MDNNEHNSANGALGAPESNLETNPVSTAALRAELSGLHTRLEQVLHKEPLDKDMFGQVMTEMVNIAHGDASTTESAGNLKEKLKEHAADFETNHPRVAGILSDVMAVLAKMGI